MLMGDKGEDAGQHGKGEGTKASMWRAETLCSLPPPPTRGTASRLHSFRVSLCCLLPLSIPPQLVETKPLLFLVSS